MRAKNPTGFRVVLASTQAGWGGGEVYLSTLAIHLRNRGYDVSFVVRAGSAMEDYVYSDGFEAISIQGKGRSPFDLWRLRKLLQTSSQVVLHCNDSHSLTFAGLASVGIGTVKVVAMRHTMFPIRSPRKYRRLSDCVVGVSYAVVDTCECQGIPASHLRVIHAGINPPVAENAAVKRLRQEFLGASGKRLVVAVGNLLACKGHRDLVSAAGILKARGINVRTVIAGEGEERVALEKQIVGLELQDDVLLAGFRTDADQLLASADVVAHPAYEEGLCLTVAAALMLKRPVVSTAVGGLKDVIGVESRMDADGPFAVVVEPGHADQLAAALGKRLEKLPEVHSVADAAAYATERFSATQMVDETIRLYHDLWNAAAIAA